jgi:uncharacterized protein YbjQ (UPF0145 family)
MAALFELFITIVVFACLLGLGYFVGHWTESRHFRSIREREGALRHVMVFSAKTPPAEFGPCRTFFVSGSVVVGMDYFKRFAASLRNLVGGHVGAYETLIERARREAVLRMKAEAAEAGATSVFNIKFSTATVMTGNSANKGAGCVEVLAYGTALAPE